MDRLLKSKTFWTGASAVIAAGAGYATGDLSAAAALQTAITGALGVFLRLGLAKIEARLEKQF